MLFGRPFVTATIATLFLLGLAIFGILSSPSGAIAETWIQDLQVSPAEGVASFRPMTIQALGSASGDWQVTILGQGGITVETLPTATGTSFLALWAPQPHYQIAGNHLASVHLQTGQGTATASAAIQVYNYPLQVSGYKYYNTSFQPILSPKAGQKFYIEATATNISPNAYRVFLPFMVSNKFIGAGINFNLAAGGSFSQLMPVSLASGTYQVQAFAWDGPGGTPLSEPCSKSLEVVP